MRHSKLLLQYAKNRKFNGNLTVLIGLFLLPGRKVILFRNVHSPVAPDATDVRACLRYACTFTLLSSLYIRTGVVGWEGSLDLNFMIVLWQTATSPNLQNVQLWRVIISSSRCEDMPLICGSPSNLPSGPSLILNYWLLTFIQMTHLMFMKIKEQLAVIVMTNNDDKRF